MVRSILLALAAACALLQAQDFRYRGRVLERANLEPVPGARVRWSGSALEAVTGPDGRFELRSGGSGVREGAVAAGSVDVALFRSSGARESEPGFAATPLFARGEAAEAARKAQAAKAGATALEISREGLRPKVLSPASSDQDFGDVILDYPPRVLDVGSPPVYGSLVLFAGGDSAAARAELEEKWAHWVGPWRKSKGLGATPVLWKIVPDPEAPGRSALMSCCLPRDGSKGWGYDDLLSKRAFRDFQLHVEFNMMGAYDDGKPDGYCNSGVYLQNRYEVQIMTPDGIGPLDNHDIASLVDDRPPDKNVIRPQGKWQAYDITFRSARWNGRTKLEDARATVYWNGVLVHDNVAARGIATGGDSGVPLDSTVFHGLKLQSEGSDVRFRNVWVKELDLKTPQTNTGY